jgi:hypothetical protein
MLPDLKRHKAVVASLALLVVAIVAIVAIVALALVILKPSTQMSWKR